MKNGGCGCDMRSLQTEPPGLHATQAARADAARRRSMQSGQPDRMAGLTAAPGRLRPRGGWGKKCAHGAR